MTLSKSTLARRSTVGLFLLALMAGMFAGARGASANNAPVAFNDAFSMGSNGTLNVAAPGVLKNDADPEGNAVRVNDLGVSSPGGASISIRSNGSFTYTPPKGFVGKAFFQYQVTDGVTPGNFATVSIDVVAGGNVNVAPVANADAFTGTKGRRLQIDAKGVLKNDTDANGDTLKASLVAKPAQGTLVLKQDGGFVFTPPSNTFAGTVTFTYKAFDGAANSNVVTVTITLK